jgi:bifunctional UDP-N-acetylglucosamine pyrophosphorylase/glucosamine-1-phosphate N-acetyltransferase
MQDNSLSLTIVILGAGAGTRMLSCLPKVLHNVALQPMLGHMLRLSKVFAAKENTKVVVSNELVQEEIYNDLKKEFSFHEVIQEEKLGTGDAVKSAVNSAGGIKDNVLILYGDTPLVTEGNIKPMVGALKQGADLCVTTFTTSNPYGYGRVVVGAQNRVKEIIEEVDTDRNTSKIKLCNSGIMMMKAQLLHDFLAQSNLYSRGKEFYLTDIAAFACENNFNVQYVQADLADVMGVNTKQELKVAEEIMQQRIQECLLLAKGVSLIQPETSFFAYDIKAERDVVIYPNVFIGPNVVLERGSVIHSFSHLQGCLVSAGASIGPFARVRPQTKISSHAKIGNFVEIKNSDIGGNSKISHMSYVGDAKIGKDVNIGAGTVFCNYDGHKKHESKVEEGSFIGANSTLISPVNVGEQATVAAGSVINNDVEKGALAIARQKQKNLLKKSIVKKAR